MKHRFRKGLCAVFAAVVVGSAGCGLIKDTLPDLSPPADDIPESSMPSVINAFGKSAHQADRNEAYAREWEDAERFQNDFEHTPANQQRYEEYLRQFDRFGHQTLREEADDVNRLVKDQLTYTTDPTLYGVDDYMAAPYQTAFAERGDCEDYAILQYDIMRHLGVPEERLFLAVVSANDDSAMSDHVVLLLDVAAAKAAPDYVVLNDGGPVRPSTDYIKGGTVPGWGDDYEFYAAINDEGFWKTADADRNIYVYSSDEVPQLAATSPQRAAYIASAPTGVTIRVKDMSLKKKGLG